MFTRRSDQPRIQIGFLTSLVLIGMAILPHGYAQQGATPTGESIASLRQRAESGDPGAQTELSFRYYQGQGVAQDNAEALRWIRKAVDQGFAPAQVGLATTY